VELAQMTTQVLPKGMKQINSDELLQVINHGNGGSAECYVHLDSDQPVMGWASQIDNSTNDPGFSVGKNMGGKHLLIPSSANTGNWSSSLVVVNPNNQPAYVDIVARDNNGAVQGRLMGMLVPAYGFFSSENILSYLGVGNGFGPIEVSTPYSITPIMATSRVRSTNRTGGFFEAMVLD
jgi:hypothetical protein